jgi:Fic family protein
VLIELERLKGADEDARVLCAVSRYVDTPAEIGLRFTEDGYERGETTEIRTADSRRRVLAALEELGGSTAKQVGAKAEVSESTARRRLRELEEDAQNVVSDSSRARPRGVTTANH